MLQSKIPACRVDILKDRTRNGSSEEKPPVHDNGDSQNLGKHSASPVKVFFGRPDFVTLFKSFIKPKSKEFHVYSTTSPALNNIINIP